MINEQTSSIAKKRYGKLLQELSRDAENAALAYADSLTAKDGQRKDTGRSETFGSLRIDGLHLLLREILLCVVKGSMRTTQLFIRQFIAIQSVFVPKNNAERRRFRRASEFSPTLAAFLYGASSVGVSDQYIYGERRCEERSNTGAILAMSHEKLWEAFSLQENNTVALVRSLLGKAMGILKNSLANLRFSWCESHVNSEVLDG